MGLKLILFISLFVTSVLGSNATAVRRMAGFPSINPPECVLTHIGTRSQSLLQLNARRFTNARRLYEGLPLNPPKRRRWHEVAHPVPSGTPGGNGEVPRGYIQSYENDTLVGHITNTLNSFGDYGCFTEDITQVLMVLVDLWDAVIFAVDIMTINDPNALYPFFGGIHGFASSNINICIASSNYMFIGPTTESLPDSTAIDGQNSFNAAASLNMKIESAVWKYDYATMNLTAHWVNVDSSIPETFIGLIDGDKDKFSNAFGPTRWPTLRFVYA